MSQIEHPLRWNELYQEYVSMIESKLEEFLAAESIPIEDVIAAVSDSIQRQHTCIDYLLATTEYPSFLQLMQDFVSMQDWGCTEVALDAAPTMEAVEPAAP
mmetsp:Transcript_57175/g.124235  ORF Transcript_57175/g.124235 Transcript_57175/m.124235 type:complete len:101 (+) Transcript_57175:899-1201(+)